VFERRDEALRVDDRHGEGLSRVADPTICEVRLVFPSGVSAWIVADRCGVRDVLGLLVPRAPAAASAQEYAF
jgi:hypothetical protein